MTAVEPMTARMTRLTAQVRAVMPAVMTVLLVLLFLGTAFGSVVMSANGTMTFAVNHHMPPAIQWAPVLVLELSQVAGTVWWLVSAGWSRAGAVVMVTGIAMVTAGLSQVTYGWVLALSASVLMVGTIHAIACVIRASASNAAAPEVQVPRADGWTKRTARDRARELGVSQAGTVSEIVARITAAEEVAS